MRIGRPCCGCTNNLKGPEVRAILCIAGQSVEVLCSCRCHVVREVAP